MCVRVTRKVWSKSSYSHFPNSRVRQRGIENLWVLFAFLLLLGKTLYNKSIEDKISKRRTHGGKPAENGAKYPGVSYLQHLCRTFNFSTNALQQLRVSCLLPGMSSLFSLTNSEVNKSRSPQCQLTPTPLPHCPTKSVLF